MGIHRSTVWELARELLHDFVTKQRQQLLELLCAAVYVTDHVERAVLSLLVVPEWCALDCNGLDRLGRVENVDLAEALALEPTQSALELALLITDHVRPEVAIRPIAV